MRGLTGIMVGFVTLVGMASTAPNAPTSPITWFLYVCSVTACAGLGGLALIKWMDHFHPDVGAKRRAGTMEASDYTKGITTAFLLWALAIAVVVIGGAFAVLNGGG